MYLDKMKRKHLTSADREWTPPTNAIIRAIRSRSGAATFKAEIQAGKGDSFTSDGVYSTGAAMELEYATFEYGPYTAIEVVTGKVTVFYTNITEDMSE